MSKLEKGEEHNLTPGELDRIEKAIFEIARQQRGKLVPVTLPFPDFWSRVGQLIIHLEQDIDDMRREGAGSAPSVNRYKKAIKHQDAVARTWPI